MFTETTLHPSKWKIRLWIILGTALLIPAFSMLGRDSRIFWLLLLFGSCGSWACWRHAYALSLNRISIRAFGMEIKRHSAEPLFIEWKEIERIGIAVFNNPYLPITSNGHYIGLRLMDKCAKRHTEGYEKNRTHSNYDILLSDIYGLNHDETVALLNEKMFEATGRVTSPSPDTEPPQTLPEPLPADEAPSAAIHETQPEPDTYEAMLCFESKCPSCMTTQTFYLETPSWDEHRIKGTVRCPACKLARPTYNEAEWEKLKQSALIWRNVEEGTLEKETAISEILALKSKVLGRIAYESQTWLCKSCNAENPVHFDECWKCQKLREKTAADDNDILPIDFDEK